MFRQGLGGTVKSVGGKSTSTARSGDMFVMKQALDIYG
jgi:hypothetical protein